MSKKEIENALKEKNKINNSDYYSTVDDIINVSELLNVINNSSN